MTRTRRHFLDPTPARAPRRLARVLPVAARAALVLALLVSAASAAEPESGAVAGSAAEAAPADALGRDTPRGAYEGFVQACSERDFHRAAHYLDLRGVAGEGPVLAQQLETVLSRTLWVNPEDLSDQPEGQSGDGLPASRDRLGTIQSRHGDVPVLLEREREGGAQVWKFAASTVARVPALYSEFGYGFLERILPQAFFRFQLLDIALWQWIALLMLVLVAAGVSWGLAVAGVWILRPLAARTETTLDDRLIQAVAAPVRLALAVPLFRAGLLPLGLDLATLDFLGTLLRALFIVAITWLAIRITDLLSARVEERLVARGQASAITLVPPGRKAVKVTVAALGGVAILDSFGFSVTALLAGLGVGGIAVALAAQKTVENLFGGVTLYADRPVRVGDFCRFGSQVGTVEEIGLRSTRIRTLDRTLVTVPNGEFSNLQLENFASRDRIRLYATLGVRYETTPEQLRYILVEVRKLLYSHERITPDPARIRFVGFGAYSLDLEVFAYADTADWNEFLGIREDVFLRIMDIIEASGTGFAFPSQTLYLGSDAAPTAERATEVAEQVQRWRERREVFLPEFPPERIAELAKTVRYPAEGSPLRHDRA